MSLFLDKDVPLISPELLNPWRLASLGVGLVLLVLGSVYLPSDDWDVPLCFVMGLPAYVLAPWTVRQAFGLRWKWLVPAAFAFWLTVDGTYTLYWSLKDFPHLAEFRPANFFYCTPIFWIAGCLWNVNFKCLEWRLPKAAELEVFQLEGLRLILPGFVIVAMIAAVRAVAGIPLIDNDAQGDVAVRTQVTEQVVAAMKRLNVKEFSGKAGESLTDVVGRLHEISRAGLPGQPEGRNGITIELRLRSGSSGEPLVSDFLVEDISFYEAVEAFCKAARYQFEVDGGRLVIAPAESELPEFSDLPELKEARLCGHGSVSDEERELLHRMRETRLATMSFRPPATLKDVVEFFRSASAPVGERDEAIDIRVEAVTDAYATQPIPELSAWDISFYDAIRLIAECVGFKLEIRGTQVVIKECTGCELIKVYHK